MAPRRYVVVAGNIAVGKTSVVRRLKNMVAGSLAFTEQRDEFIDRYYVDPAGYSFLSQLGYTLQFLEQAVLISKASNDIVFQDRSVYDTHEVFSRLRLERGFISAEEFLLLERAYRSADMLIRPSLIVLLDAPPSVAYFRIMRRGVGAEEAITLGYLTDLRAAYLEWYRRLELCPKVMVPTEHAAPEAVALKILEFL